MIPDNKSNAYKSFQRGLILALSADCNGKFDDMMLSEKYTKHQYIHLLIEANNCKNPLNYE